MRPLPNILVLAVSFAAVVVVFLPFAFDTSPLNAVMLRVPGNQGNWWHVLVGAPFFLAFPMIWLRLQPLISGEPLATRAYRIIAIVAALSICGTIAVETPFLLHLAGTSEWQRFVVLALGFGIIVASATILSRRRQTILPDRACFIALITAYLANAALCLVVYSGATGPVRSRSGWLITMIIVWPLLLELILMYLSDSRQAAPSPLAQR